MSTALVKLAENTGVSSEEIAQVVRGMIISSKGQHGATATDAEMTVVAGICAKFGLNPLTKEAHAFVSGGKLSVMIGIDGWLSIMNRQATFNGVEFDYEFDEKELVSVTTKIHIKGRDFPVEVTEWMDECFQPKSDAWRKYKKRMLRNKSLGQCIRVAFGISEVIDQDEADRIKSNEPEQVVDVTPISETKSHEVYNQEMAKCGDLDILKQVCGQIRKSLEACGKWEAYKPEIVALNTKHKDRINSYNTEDAEFEEVSDLQERADKLVNETEAFARQVRGDSVVIENEPDIGFGEDEEQEEF